MKPIHILNGDCLAEQLSQSNLNKDFIICRECLVEGDVLAENLEDFWRKRSEFISESYHVTKEEYLNKTVSEFEKLNKLPDHTEICLWFENDLFCQVNMWFIISLLVNNSSLKIFRVFPVIEKKEDTWKGFGISDAQKLEHAFDSRILFSGNDLILGKNLWEAFQRNDFEKLKTLSRTQSNCFQYLEEVCQAHIERFPMNQTSSRPERVIKDILISGTTEFQEVFMEFSSLEGIYGFSDQQIKSIYDRFYRRME